MRHAIRSLRFRLSVAYVLIFGVLQLVVWFTVDIARTNYLYRQFDQSMAELAQTMGSVLSHAAKKEMLRMTDKACAEVLGYFESPKTAVQVRNDKGEVLWRSTAMLGYEIPMPQELSRFDLNSGPQSTFTNAAGRNVGTLGGEGDTIRVFTLLVGGKDTHVYALQIAQSLATLETVRDDIRELLLVFGITSLVLAGATSWIMVGRTMRPIVRITRETAAISTTNLERRLQSPGAGDEISALIDVLNGMLERLEREFAHQKQFIANVAHELKTPLTVLLGEVQSVQRHRGEGDIAEFAETVREEARRMLRTIETFLILSRVQRGERLAIVADVAVVETVLEAVQACQEAARARAVRIVPRMQVDETAAEPVVRGDDDLLRSMLENLIHNAVRHSPEGGVVRVDTTVAVKDVSITVEDDGTGIPDNQFNEIFEPFVQAGADNTRGSAGVGLAIAKGVANLHGGTISAENHNGGGARVSVRLPLAPEA